MQRHWNRTSYYVVGEGTIEEPALFGPAASGAEPETLISEKPSPPTFKFGRMFDLRQRLSDQEREEIIPCLIDLGTAMNDPTKSSVDSNIPAGYTYLGQVIAHEVTFDNTPNLPHKEFNEADLRSPQIDLDSLYGLGPKGSPELYQDHARLKEGETELGDDLIDRTFHNDLPRVKEGDRYPALLGDPRNDENLAVAQTHVALIKFHNKVVDRLEDEKSPKTVFENARREVTQHFQAIILEDFLPQLLGPTLLRFFSDRELSFLDPDGTRGVFMPLEFAVAAFRIGHSMVRDFYEWNYFQCAEPYRNGHPRLAQLFKLTNFSGNLDHAKALKSDWVIDWRRFFDFDELGYAPDGRLRNKAKKIDTIFNFHLDQIPGFPHADIDIAERSITVRNLLRGLALDLPSGEAVAGEISQRLGIDTLSAEAITNGPHKELLNAAPLRGRIPLWYYILKEAELDPDGRLGPVGGCIIAETLIALIKKSPYSILSDADWCAKLGRRVEGAKTRSYKMVDLLDFANVVDPIGQYDQLK